jgi:hypothetical protein
VSWRKFLFPGSNPNSVRDISLLGSSEPCGRSEKEKKKTSVWTGRSEHEKTADANKIKLGFEIEKCQ